MFLRCLAFVLNTGDKKWEERVQRDKRDYIEMTLTFFRGNKEKNIFSEKGEIWQNRMLLIDNETIFVISFFLPISKRRSLFIIAPKVNVHFPYSLGPASRQQGVCFKWQKAVKMSKFWMFVGNETWWPSLSSLSVLASICFGPLQLSSLC